MSLIQLCIAACLTELWHVSCSCSKLYDITHVWLDPWSSYVHRLVMFNACPCLHLLPSINVCKITCSRKLLLQYTLQDPNTTLTSAPTNLNREIRLMRQNMASGDLDLNPLGMVREGSAEGNSSSGTLGTAISGALNAITRISRRSIGSLDITPGGRGSGSLDAPAGRHSPANMDGSVGKQ